MSARTLAAVAALLLGLGVALGAMAAHALKTRLSADMLAVFETAARYHVSHALGLFALAAFIERGVSLQGAAWCLLVGMALFCGSLYVLALSGVRWLGAITPFGGVAFLSGWAWAALALWRAR